ncbi:uncharacterized protein LOC121785564 isoform X1 [Salvia splendens]|nr:uncharacterized protein LOC121785564 isoform X1 [Salvia splendens]XP_042039955.1 uncharacterized protein LOC121785564 isoform X1 [Salvia splendens]
MYKTTAEHKSDEEETSCSTAGQPFRMHKRRKVRKGFAQIVTSESESDDKIPLSRLTHRPDTQPRRRFVNDSCFGNNLRQVTPRRHLLRVGYIKDNSVSGKCSQRRSGNRGDLGISENTTDTLLEDEMEGMSRVLKMKVLVVILWTAQMYQTATMGLIMMAHSLGIVRTNLNVIQVRDRHGECTGEGRGGVMFDQRKDELADTGAWRRVCRASSEPGLDGKKCKICI